MRTARHEFMTTHEFATATRCGVDTVQRAIADKRIPATKFGRRWLIPRTHLESINPMPKLRPTDDALLNGQHDIAAIIAANEAEDRREAEEAAADERLLAAATRARDDRFVTMQRELARDLGCSVNGVTYAIKVLSVPPGLELARAALSRVTWTDRGAVDPAVVCAARHVLARAKIMPKIRADDAAFADLGQLRNLPPTSHLPGFDISHMLWLEPFARDLGITIPVLLDPDLETPNDAFDRTERLHASGGYVRFVRSHEGLTRSREDSIRSRALADRDCELACQAYHRARRELRKGHLDAMLALRISLIAAIDRALAARDIDAGWFYGREMRRWLACERRLSDDFELVRHQASAAGFKIEMVG